MHFLSPALILLSTLALSGTAGAQTFTRVQAGAPATDLSNSSGAAWIDYNRDGYDDLFVSSRNRGNFLYENDGVGGLEAVASDPITSNSSIGSCWADFDNDGDLDAFTSGAPSFLYRNTGSGFEDATSSLGAPSIVRGWACTWADIDNDNLVDLVVTHPAGFVGTPSQKNWLFRNTGGGVFEHITSTPVSDGFAPYTVATFADYDDDGDQDLFIGSGPADGTKATDYLYRNLFTESGSLSFERIMESPLATALVDGQVWNWIDYDNDGDLDVYLTNYWGGEAGGMPNRLYRKDGDRFTQVGFGSLVRDGGLSLASAWGDYDNDGDLDVVVANATPASRYYRNNGDGTFTSLIVSALSGTATSWGATHADYDDDGDLDLFIANADAGQVNWLIRNDLDSANHWLKVRLVPEMSNGSAIGATVRVKATIAGKSAWQRRTVSSQNTFCGQNSLVVHFGMGDAAAADSLVVEWPSGVTDVFTDVIVDATANAAEGTSVTSTDHPPALASEPTRVFGTYPNPALGDFDVDLQTNRNGFVDISVYDLLGRERHSMRQWMTSGRTSLRVPAGGLEAGVYLLVIRLDGDTRSLLVSRFRE